MLDLKPTEECKTHLPFDMKAEFVRAAHEIGCDPSELQRDLICKFIHGVTFVELVAKHRAEAIECRGKKKGQTRAK